MPTEFGGWEWQRQQFIATDRECNKLRAELATLKKSQETNFQGLLQRINEQTDQIERLTARMDEAAKRIVKLEKGKS